MEHQVKYEPVALPDKLDPEFDFDPPQPEDLKDQEMYIQKNI